MEFGKHEGESITEVPNSYLRWLVSEFDPSGWENVIDLAEAELKIRRQTRVYIYDERGR